MATPVSNLLAVLWLALPWVFWLLRSRWPVFLGSTSRWFGFTVIGGTILWFAICAVQGVELRWDLDRHDLNGDGKISGPEMTPAAGEAMTRFASDTARSVGLILAGPLSAMWAVVNFLILSAISRLRSRVAPSKQE